MRKAPFIIAILGIVSGLISAYIYGIKTKSQPPLTVNYNPYTNGIYASGIIESLQKDGSNINIYPEVAGRVTNILVSEGQKVKKGDILLLIDDRTQKAIVVKDAAQAEAARTLLEELKAQPRKENLEVAVAQLEYAKASLKNAQDQLTKLKKSYEINPKSVSGNILDNAINAEKIAQANLLVAQKQLDLVKAGAWEYDIKNQENQFYAAVQTYQSDKKLLNKYKIKATVDGTVMRIAAAVGSYVSPQGVYNSYTQDNLPIITMGILEPYHAVRCYVEETLVPNLPSSSNLEATLLIRGKNNYTIPLEFVKIQPYVIPNIELSYQKAPRVDVRVLPIIFKFKKPEDISLYPGQLVDVYIKAKDTK